MKEITLIINPAHNIDDLTKKFMTESRLHIPNFLEPNSAKSLGDIVCNFNEWNLSLNSGDTHYDINHVTRQNLNSEFYTSLYASVGRDALLGFQYIFENYPLYDAYYSGSCPKNLRDILEFINSDSFLSFIKKISKYDDITFADSQLTKFSAGQFLTSHNDDVSGKNRRIAYVLNLTPLWNPDWGGILQFHGNDKHIEHGFVPMFNSLNLFSVPQKHSVSQIASYVTTSRYAVTGWLREGVNPLG